MVDRSAYQLLHTFDWVGWSIHHTSRWTLPLVMSSGAIPNWFLKPLGMANHAHTWWYNISPLTYRCTGSTRGPGRPGWPGSPSWRSGSSSCRAWRSAGSGRRGSTASWSTLGCTEECCWPAGRKHTECETERQNRERARERESKRNHSIIFLDRQSEVFRWVSDSVSIQYDSSLTVRANIAFEDAWWNFHGNNWSAIRWNHIYDKDKHWSNPSSRLF